MRLSCRVLFVLICLLIGPVFLAGASARDSSSLINLNEKQLDSIAGIVEDSINSGKIPGAVILIGDRDRIIYRKAFGYRSIFPERVEMTTDTIFDLASLTKVVATTTAIMQLEERGLLRIGDPVAKYWPEFKAHGKRYITIKDLLTHYSGLRPDLSLRSDWTGYKGALKRIIEERPVCPRDTRYIYSDINFEILGELVRRISGLPLDVYCEENIFRPLGMKDTGFNPDGARLDRVAPTQFLNGSGKMLCGEVHDPAAYRMGGVAGHAGLFSTADDLSIFARMLLEGGSLDGVHILNKRTVEKMTSPNSPRNGGPVRGLGWFINSPSSGHRSMLLPPGTYGHTGYTGTSMWIDPASGTYGIILTNRVHPDGKGDARPLRTGISMLMGKVVARANDRAPETEHAMRNVNAVSDGSRIDAKEERFRTGIDVLEAEKFAPLKGLRVGLITNHSGLDSNGRSTLDLLYRAPGVKLRAIFCPEHGLSGRVDRKISSAVDVKTGLPIYSLYGDSYRPTRKMLKGLDALVFDVQDAGVRFYTYISTMGYAMEEAAKKGLDFYVLDRPDPITASTVQGPVMDENMRSFTGYFPLPVRYGMTVGELAKMFNKESGIGAKLHVIRMRGYDRDDWYDQTGLPWVNPSPNLRSLKEMVLYPGVALVEGANVSVGRGTRTPFELLGAPWIKAARLASYLNKRRIRGVGFKPANFVPKADRYKNRECHGVRLILLDRKRLDPSALGVEIISALHRLFKKKFHLSETLSLIGSRKVLQLIKEGRSPSSIEGRWQRQLARFRQLREKYLLY